MAERGIDMGTALAASPPMSEADFVQVRQEGFVLLVRPGLRGDDLVQDLMAGETQMGRRYALKRIPSAASSRVFRFSASIEGTARLVYFKEYVDRSLWDGLKHAVRASRARRALRGSLVLAEGGLAVPEVVAIGEKRTRFLTKRCFLLTLAVTESLSVYTLLSKDSGGLDAVELHRKRDLIRTLGHTIGRMHAQGIVHGDLRPGNVLGRFRAGQWELFFLDNERTCRFPWLPARLRRKNLVQIGMLLTGITRTDRFRFWQAYLAESPRLGPRQKGWARRIHARTIERLRKWTDSQGTDGSG